MTAIRHRRQCGHAVDEQAGARPLGEHGSVAQADEVMLGAGDGDVEQVGARIQESEGACVRDHAAEEHDAAFAALKTVHGAERTARLLLLVINSCSG